MDEGRTLGVGVAQRSALVHPTRVQTGSQARDALALAMAASTR